MKKCVTGFLLVLLLAGTRAGAQAQEAQQLLLNVEKLAQLKSMLEDLKRGYQVVFEGYSTIKNISEGNFNLHDQFLEGLLQVPPVVKNYGRVWEIIRTQKELVSQYQTAYRLFGESGLLTGEELRYLSKVYAGVFQQSLGNLEALTLVLTAGRLRMSEGERLSAIDALWTKMEESRIFLRRFNEETKLLFVARAKERANGATLKKLYSLNY